MNNKYEPKERCNWLWLDFETTGVDERPYSDDERGDVIIEYAAAVANDGAKGDFQIIDYVTGIIRQGELKMEPFVALMHAKSGLLEELMNVKDDEVELEFTAEEKLCDFVLKHFPGEEKVILAGSTVAFDWRFIREHMTTLFSQLSHRTFDVSTLKMEERAWCDPSFDVAETDKKHRALEDVKYSLEVARRIRDRRKGWTTTVSIEDYMEEETTP